MFTDMVGSTAAAQANEAAALRLRDEQEAIVRPLFSAHQGREVKSMGDGFLVEFDSALRAVQCAIDIQQTLHNRNSQPSVVPIQLRIGVHLGDVERRETDIFGDAVNIASRVEPLASPGGVCVTGEVFSQIRNKIPNKFEKLPPTGLKGVQVSIEIYRVVLPWSNRELASETSGPAGIAVLPFTNISPDPTDEYFADGLTEELITVLSQLRELRVISRTSVMLYKATPKSASQIGAELGVVSILEGSVRKAGSRLRVTAQLIDARSDRHLWAKTYDRELDDVFAVQAEIAKQVAEALEVELRPAEESRLESRPTVRPDSYLAYLKGRTLFHSFSKESLEAAKEQFELAISLDSQNAAAHAGLADVIRVVGMNYSDFPREDWEETSRRLATRAIDLDPSLAEAHTSLALILWTDYDFTAAEREFRLALSLNPSYSLAHYTYAAFMQDECRTDEALQEHALAEAADPLSSLNLAFLAPLLIDLGKLDEAFFKIQKMGELEPDGLSYHLALMAYHLARSDLDQGLKEIRRIVELRPAPRDKQLTQALYYALSGEKEQARALLRQDQTLPDRPRVALVIARIYAVLGDLDECFRWLERAIESHFIAIRAWRLDPRLKSVRDDPRFPALLKKMNLA
jgi:adenylate cyclase